jgi:hypothetical protein
MKVIHRKPLLLAGFGKHPHVTEDENPDAEFARNMGNLPVIDLCGRWRRRTLRECASADASPPWRPDQHRIAISSIHLDQDIAFLRNYASNYPVQWIGRIDRTDGVRLQLPPTASPFHW